VVEQGTHKPLVTSSNLVATTIHDRGSIEIRSSRGRYQ
jgi:hypothetical protein